MFDCFVVECEDKEIGIAVRTAGGYRFFASDPEFNELEGILFPGARRMAHRVAQLAVRNRREVREPQRKRRAPEKWKVVHRNLQSFRALKCDAAD